MVPRLTTCAVLVALLGCDPEEAGAEPVQQQDLCAEAVAHVARCKGGGAEPPLVCDPQLAAELLELSCARLDDQKTDRVDNLLCDFGILRHCPLEVCPDALGFDHDFSATNCADLIELEGCGACDYYRCREAQSSSQCAQDGYYLGFGHEYCIRYALTTEPRLSDAGQRWSPQGRRCLMEALDADVEDIADCDALRQAGYDTHPPCYEQTRFCDLPAKDWFKILATIDPADHDFTQGLTVGLGCLAGGLE